MPVIILADRVPRAFVRLFSKTTAVTLASITRPNDWTADSWRERTALQQPEYPDQQAFERVIDELKDYPPLVTQWEVERLKSFLAEASAGKRFVLQGGDCAERFDECNTQVVTNRLKIMLQMSLILLYGMRKPIVRVGRFAGQFAKPRSSLYETRGGVTLPSYRGDIINRTGFSPEERIPDPRRMLQAYTVSALSLNYVRALSEGGFADLHHPENWSVDFMRSSPLARDYRQLLESIDEAIRFMETVAGGAIDELDRVSFFTSHEALHLPYEQALTRSVPTSDRVYNLSTHFPWIGMRTAQLDGAHVEYARGISNPLAIKVGPTMSRTWLRDLINTLNPGDEPGRLTLITRLGADQIGSRLPEIIDGVRATGKRVLWICDPMHGNTEQTENGIKTRRFENILSELEQAFEIHHAEGTYLGGVHFEMTGEDVTECTGGARGLKEADLTRAYRSHVDPRLNYEQALEMAFSIARKYKAMRRQA